MLHCPPAAGRVTGLNSSIPLRSAPLPLTPPHPAGSASTSSSWTSPSSCCCPTCTCRCTQRTSSTMWRTCRRGGGDACCVCPAASCHSHCLQRAHLQTVIMLHAALPDSLHHLEGSPCRAVNALGTGSCAESMHASVANHTGPPSAGSTLPTPSTPQS